MKWAQSLSRVGFDKPGRGSRDISYKYNFALESLHTGTVLHSELTPCWASTGYLFTQGSSLTHSASPFPAAHVLVTRNNVLMLSLVAKGWEKSQAFCRSGRTLLPSVEMLTPGSFTHLPWPHPLFAFPMKTLLIGRIKSSHPSAIRWIKGREMWTVCLNL